MRYDVPKLLSKLIISLYERILGYPNDLKLQIASEHPKIRLFTFIHAKGRRYQKKKRFILKLMVQN